MSYIRLVSWWQDAAVFATRCGDAALSFLFQPRRPATCIMVPPYHSPQLNDSILPNSPLPALLVAPTSHVPLWTQLPEEIIEYIAECMRYPIYPRAEAMEAFLTEGRTSFSAARFSLSSFSQVCTTIRFAVERLLYRDIHVDIVGWTDHIDSCDTQKHPLWPAGCLRLLSRTLEERPELGRFVRSVDLRLSDHYLSPSTMDEQVRFLKICPGLQSLSMSSLPSSFIEHLERLNLQITSFAAVSPAANLPRIVSMFPNLRNLYLHIYGHPSSFSVPDHAISELHLKLVADTDLQGHLLQLAFAIPRQNVRTFHLERKDTRSESNIAVVAFPKPTTSMQAFVEHLRLKNIDPFTPVKIDGTPYLPLASMTSLRHLHVLRPFLLPAHAFSLLPPNLRSLTFSDYALDSKKSSVDSKSCFVKSVVDCLKADSQNLKLAGIKTYGAIPDDPWELGDLTPLRMVCRKANVPFIQIGAFADLEPELMLFFKRC
ncbi:hypothetical protein C8R43DRAFT_978616 [Mycena crocata]|nr:hypothetical protein C8R43DRAFT_978616 [Mycena crocata]